MKTGVYRHRRGDSVLCRSSGDLLDSWVNSRDDCGRVEMR
jgi:hypothetical protein